MSLQPLEDRIVVRPGDAEETTVIGPSPDEDATEAQGAAAPARTVAGRGMRWRPPRAPESWFVVPSSTTSSWLR